MCRSQMAPAQLWEEVTAFLSNNSISLRFYFISFCTMHRHFWAGGTNWSSLYFCPWPVLHEVSLIAHILPMPQQQLGAYSTIMFQTLASTATPTTTAKSVRKKKRKKKNQKTFFIWKALQSRSPLSKSFGQVFMCKKPPNSKALLTLIVQTHEEPQFSPGLG